VSSKTSQARKRLTKRAKKGFQGYPIGTLAFYGPDDRRATKLVASIVEREGEEPSVMEKWFGCGSFGTTKNLAFSVS